MLYSGSTDNNVESKTLRQFHTWVGNMNACTEHHTVHAACQLLSTLLQSCYVEYKAMFNESTPHCMQVSIQPFAPYPFGPVPLLGNRQQPSLDHARVHQSGLFSASCVHSHVLCIHPMLACFSLVACAIP